MKKKINQDVALIADKANNGTEGKLAWFDGMKNLQEMSSELVDMTRFNSKDKVIIGNMLQIAFANGLKMGFVQGINNPDT